MFVGRAKDFFSDEGADASGDCQSGCSVGEGGESKCAFVGGEKSFEAFVSGKFFLRLFSASKKLPGKEKPSGLLPLGSFLYLDYFSTTNHT